MGKQVKDVHPEIVFVQPEAMNRLGQYFSAWPDETSCPCKRLYLSLAIAGVGRCGVATTETYVNVKYIKACPRRNEERNISYKFLTTTDTSQYMSIDKTHLGLSYS